MFFPMLRRQAKWMFVLLALVFAGGFVFFGVGSGQGGLGDVLQGWLGNGSSASGPSISKLEQQTRENPKDANAFHELGRAFAADQKTDKAIAALERYTALKPRDAGALQELGSLQLTRADDFARIYVNAQSQSQALTPSPTFKPQSTSPLAQALQDPLSTALSETSNQLHARAARDGIERGHAAIVLAYGRKYKKPIAFWPAVNTITPLPWSPPCESS